MKQIVLALGLMIVLATLTACATSNKAVSVEPQIQNGVVCYEYHTPLATKLFIKDEVHEQYSYWREVTPTHEIIRHIDDYLKGKPVKHNTQRYACFNKPKKIMASTLYFSGNSLVYSKDNFILKKFFKYLADKNKAEEYQILNATLSNTVKQMVDEIMGR